MDDRNYEVTNKLYDVLDNTKGFDVAMSNPRMGKILARYKGVNFYVSVEPVFCDTEEGNLENQKPFSEIVKNHTWIWK